MIEINHLIIDTEGTKEEAVENLKEALDMEIKLGGGNVTKGEEGGDGNLRSQGDLEASRPEYREQHTLQESG